MALLALVDADARLGEHAGAAVLSRHGTVVRTVPVHEIDEVHVYGAADLTPAGRDLLLRHGIDTVFLTLDGRVRGRLVSQESKAGERRLAQYRFLVDEPRRLGLARAIVAGKVANQHAMLFARQRHLRAEAVADALVALRAAPRQLEAASSLDAVRGVEGAAAVAYFGAFPTLLQNPAFPWAGRNRHPPLDPVNACLSFGYALLVARLQAAVEVAGLDPWLGALHDAGRGKPAMALDLAEEFRPSVDAMVLTLLNRRQLSSEDFVRPEGADVEAVHLGPVGREIFLREWARRLGHPVAGIGTVADLLVAQARKMTKTLLGEEAEYAPWRPG